MEQGKEKSVGKLDNSKEIKILVTGGSGFIGSGLLKNLIYRKNSANYPYFIRCLTRNKKSINNLKIDEKDIQIVEGDLSNYNDCLNALDGIDIAYYLVHSMEGSTKDWKKFSQKEQTTAENFSRAATQCNVKRIIYLGGLTHAQDNEISQHMLSRKKVGETLAKSNAKVTIFRAAVILGSGGGSFEMLRYLVERLPVMVCPKWVLTKCQPIFIGDVITYLSRSIENPQTEGKTFDIGGPDILTYRDMMKIYARILDKSIRVLIIPFLTPRLSSYWVDLVTPIKASLARPLIDSLKHEATVKDDSIKKMIPIQLKNFEEAIKSAKEEQMKKEKIARRERTSHSLNNRILLMSLFAMVAIGSTYYIFDARPEIFQGNWLILSGCWYL